MDSEQIEQLKKYVKIEKENALSQGETFEFETEEEENKRENEKAAAEAAKDLDLDLGGADSTDEKPAPVLNYEEEE
jgi:hypothetical protein